MGKYVHIYTDGSFNKDAFKGSWAFVVVDPENDEILHEDCGLVTLPNFLEMWNVAGELFASLKACTYMRENGHAACIYHDYEGVGKWARFEWKAKKSATQQYQKSVQDLIASKRLVFQWVPGHSGNKFNERADELCRVAMRR